MREFLRKWKKYFVFVALLSCFINILQLTFAFYMFTIYRNIVSSHHEPSLYTITVIAMYALVSLGFFNYLRTRLLNTAGVDLDQSMGETVFRHVIRSFSLPGKNRYARGVDDLHTVRNYFNNPGLYALFDAPWAPLYLLLIYFFHPVLGIVATAGAIVIFSLSLLQDKLTRKRLGNANANYGRNQKMVHTALRNAETVNSMGMSGNICDRWDRANEAVITDQTIASRYAGALQSMTRPIQIMMQVLIYGIGAYYAMLGQIDVGLMVAAAIIMGQALGPIMRAMGAWRFTVQAGAAFQRLNRFMAHIARLPDKMPLPGPEGRVEARNLFLRFGQVHLVRNVSFMLEPGQIMGVIGPSGAGKSTLCRIITGVWPVQGGEIRLDGVALHYWDPDMLGPHVGYLPQEVELFDATIAENIARMGAVNENRLARAARAVGIHEWLSSLPDGLHTQLSGPEGVALSGGQRQRVGLARALYGSPRLLVLDEPNANLDTEGEAALVGLISEIRRERSATCVIVTHKQEILAAADSILVLKDGQTAAFGPKNQVFRHLAAASAGRQAG